MTSPTTSADAEYHVSVLRELSATLIDRSPSRHAAIEYAIATLAQHAEAGAVAEWRWVDERGRAMTKWVAGDPPPMDSVSDEKGTMRVEIRPAQPASQQGEAVAWLRDIDGTGSLHVAAAGDPGAFPVFPHPTGDKVRGLVEKWREWADELKRTGQACVPNSYRVCADELAAALDQEKNDGR